MAPVKFSRSQSKHSLFLLSLSSERIPKLGSNQGTEIEMQMSVRLAGWKNENDHQLAWNTFPAWVQAGGSVVSLRKMRTKHKLLTSLRSRATTTYLPKGKESNCRRTAFPLTKQEIILVDKLITHWSGTIGELSINLIWFDLPGTTICRDHRQINSHGNWLQTGQQHQQQSSDKFAWGVWG